MRGIRSSERNLELERRKCEGKKRGWKGKCLTARKIRRIKTRLQVKIKGEGERDDRGGGTKREGDSGNEERRGCANTIFSEGE